MVLRHMMEFGKINGHLTWLTNFWIISIKSFTEISPKHYICTAGRQVQKKISAIYITTINVFCSFFCFFFFFKLGRIQIDHVYAVFGNPMVFQNNYKNKRNICSLLLVYTTSPQGTLCSQNKCSRTYKMLQLIIYQCLPVLRNERATMRASGVGTLRFNIVINIRNSI